jgi:hypothetical protein
MCAWPPFTTGAENKKKKKITVPAQENRTLEKAEQATQKDKPTETNKTNQNKKVIDNKHELRPLETKRY